MKIKQLISLAVVMMFLAGAGIMGCTTGKTAGVKAEDDSWKFHDIVDVNFVKEHVKVPMAEGVMLIDSRPKQAKYDKGHIPMAVNIPDTYFEKMTDQLPKDKNALLIFYCEGLKCKLSHKSAWKAEKLGYTNVKVYAEGFPGWMSVKDNYASVSAEWLKAQIDSGSDMVLVDSRPKEMKYDKGHIPTAISIPDTYFDKMTDQLPTDKSKLLVFYCGGYKCKLSHKSAEKAMALGYTNVKVYSAGYPTWQKLIASTPATGGSAAVKAGKAEGSIDNDIFTQIVKENPGSIYLVDVRDSDEFSTGSFKTAVNIPVDQLESKIKSLPIDKPIVFICGTGARSGESYYMVKDLRPELKDVYYLEAELTFHKDGSFEVKAIN